MGHWKQRSYGKERKIAISAFHGIWSKPLEIFIFLESNMISVMCGGSGFRNQT